MCACVCVWMCLHCIRWRLEYIYRYRIEFQSHIVITFNFILVKFSLYYRTFCTTVKRMSNKNNSAEQVKSLSCVNECDEFTGKKYNTHVIYNIHIHISKLNGCHSARDNEYRHSAPNFGHTKSNKLLRIHSNLHSVLILLMVQHILMIVSFAYAKNSIL